MLEIFPGNNEKVAFSLNEPKFETEKFKSIILSSIISLYAAYIGHFY